MLSPEDITACDFSVAPHGYDRQEVAEFLHEVAAQQDRLRRRVRELERTVRGDRTGTQDVPRDRPPGEHSGQSVPHASAPADVSEGAAPPPREAASVPATEAVVPDGGPGSGPGGGRLSGAGWSPADADEMTGAEGVRVIEPQTGPGAGADGGAVRADRVAHDPSRPRPVRMRAAAVAAARPGLLEDLREALGALQQQLLDAAEADGDGRHKVGDVEALGRLAHPHLAQAYEAGLGDGARLAGAQAEIVDAAPMRVAVGARAFGAAVSHALRLAVGAPAGEGDASAEAAGRREDPAGRPVDGALEEVTGRPLVGVVDGHLARTYSYGVYDALRVLGVTARIWLDVEEAACPEARCRMNALAGAVAMASGFPSGDLVPPAHHGCMCALEPA